MLFSKGILLNICPFGFCFLLIWQPTKFQLSHIPLALEGQPCPLQRTGLFPEPGPLDGPSSCGPTTETHLSVRGQLYSYFKIKAEHWVKSDIIFKFKIKAEHWVKSDIIFKKSLWEFPLTKFTKEAIL
jgi:hypothetical protein